MSVDNDNINLKKINLILPKNLIKMSLKKNQHLYFLAGPIRGAEDWQKEAIRMLASKDRDCYIICPCRYTKQHELYHFAASLLTANQIVVSKFRSQTLWERYYLMLASYYGAIIFWLPQENKIAPRRIEDGPYARDTMSEIGRWSIRSAYQLGLTINNKIQKRVNIVVGIEKDFLGFKTIKRNLDEDHKKDFSTSSSLKKTIDQAISLAKNTVN